MLNYFYPPDQRSLFTNRHAELAVLDLLKTQVLRGEPQRLAVWGQRRIGKTLLLKEFCARLLEENWGGLLAYVDVETIASSPENFALGYIGHLLLWYGGRWAGLPPAFLDSGSLAEAAASSELQSIRQTVGALASQLLQERPNRQALLSLALQLPERVAQEAGRPAIVILDEFCEILSLDRYEGVQVLPLFRGLMEQSSVSYILAGSAMSAMRWMADDHESPLFAQLDRLSLSVFTPDDVQELAGKLTAELEEVDLLIKENGAYSYQDPVLRFWVTANTRGIQVSPFPRQEDLTGLIGLVQERFQRARSDHPADLCLCRSLALCRWTGGTRCRGPQPRDLAGGTEVAPARGFG